MEGEHPPQPQGIAPGLLRQRGAAAARAYDKANICVKVPKNLKHPGAFSDADIEVIKSFDGDVEKLRRWMGVGYDAKRCTSAHRGVCKEKKTGKGGRRYNAGGKKNRWGTTSSRRTP